MINICKHEEIRFEEVEIIFWKGWVVAKSTIKLVFGDKIYSKITKTYVSPVSKHSNRHFIISWGKDSKRNSAVESINIDRYVRDALTLGKISCL